MWPRATWIHGDGPYASIAYCGRGTTVQLHTTPEAADLAKQVIDDSACGGLCKRRHDVVQLLRSA